MPHAFSGPMLGDAKYADMVLVCDNREWMAHRLIVCSQSSVIDFECTASTTTRHGRAVVSIHGCDAFTLQRVLQYLYQKKYDEHDSSTTLPPPCPAHSSHSDATSGMTTDGADTTEDLHVASEEERRLEETSDSLIDLRTHYEREMPINETCNSLQRLDIKPPAPFEAVPVARAWNHARVYAASLVFEIDDLAMFALKKLTTAVKGLSQQTGFTEFVRLTSAMERQYAAVAPLQRTVAWECAENIMVLADDLYFDRLLETEPALAYVVLKQLVTWARQAEQGERVDPAANEQSTAVILQVGSLSRSKSDATTPLIRPQPASIITLGKLLNSKRKDSQDRAENARTAPSTPKLEEQAPRPAHTPQSGTTPMIGVDTVKDAKNAASVFKTPPPEEPRTDAQLVDKEGTIVKLRKVIQDMQAQQSVPTPPSAPAAEVKKVHFDEMRKLRNKVDSLEGELEDREEAFRDLQAQLKDVSARSLRPELDQKVQELAELRKLLKTVTARSNAVKSDGPPTTTETTPHFKGEDEEIASLCDQVAAFTASVAKMGTLKDDANEQGEQSLTMMSEKDASHLRQLVWRLQKELQEKDIASRKCDSAVDRKSAEIVNLTNKLTRAETKISDMEKERKDIAGHKSDSTADSKMAEIVSLTNKLTRAESKVAELEKEKKDVAIRTGDSAAESTLAEIVDLTTKLKRAETKVAELEKQKRVTTESAAQASTPIAESQTVKATPPTVSAASESSKENDHPPTGPRSAQPGAAPMTFFEKMKLLQIGQQATAGATAAFSPSESVAPVIVAGNSTEPTKQKSPALPSQSDMKEGRQALTEVLRKKDEQLGQALSKIKRLTKDRDHFQAELSRLRLAPAAPRPPPHAPGNNNAIRAYREALKSAGQDFPACNVCFAPFNSQFRGAPEDEHARHLALKCTKCNAECFRWHV